MFIPRWQADEARRSRKKLLLLACDAAAYPGEAANAAVALLRSLTARHGDAHKLLAELETPSLAHVEPVRPRGIDYGTQLLPFGKHRGRRLRDVPASYLIWALKNCRNMDEYLREVIERYLRDREYG
jgi:Putative quorum-sensing-regulated virulence factor